MQGRKFVNVYKYVYIGTVGQKGKKKKRNTPIYSNINYRTEMKLVPIIMD